MGSSLNTLIVYCSKSLEDSLIVLNYCSKSLDSFDYSFLVVSCILWRNDACSEGDFIGFKVLPEKTTGDCDISKGLLSTMKGV